MLRRIFTASLFVVLMGLGSVALAGPRDFVICLPLGEGSASAATRYIKPFLRLMEKKAGWPEGSVTGRYINGMAACKAYVRSHKPGFGLLSQGLYVANRRAWRLKVIGRVDMPRGAGNRLYLVVKKGAYTSLDQLKGKTLKSNHVAEKSFLSKVIFRGKVDAARFFRLRATSSPLMGFKSVHRGRADCTLVNDDELAILKRRREGKDLEVIYKSPRLPGTPVVAFKRNASKADIAALRKALPTICSGEGKTVCQNAMIRRFRPASDGTYRSIVRLFNR